MFVRLLIGLCLLALMGTLMVATMFGSFTTLKSANRFHMLEHLGKKR
jgi:hypothetical protein